MIILFHSLMNSQMKPKWEGIEWVGGNIMGRREHSFLSIPLKPQIFIPSEIGRNERE